MSRYVHIFRTKRSHHGTEGILSTGSFTCFTIELPWKDNLPNISCIPPDAYLATPRRSPKFGNVFHVTNVEGRSHILIHSGNFAGDVEKGLRTHVQGCILLGRYRGVLDNQKVVLSSRPTVRRFMNYMDSKEFTLHIHEAF
jgi:hypothetical protein